VVLRDRCGLLASYAKMIATNGRWVILSSTMRTRRNASAERASRNGRMQRRGIKFYAAFVNKQSGHRPSTAH
jgi:hypothetical protein